MGFLDGLFRRSDNDNTPQAALAVLSEPPPRYAVLERKIDLLLREMRIVAPDVGDDASLPREVQDLIAQGQKIQAIKVYRDRTGVGLKEAKDAVEGNGGGTGSPISRLERKLDLILKEFGIEDASAPIRSAQSVPGTSEIEALIRSDRKIEAIKLYREQTGLGLKEAKEAVEAMAANQRDIM